MKKILIIFSLLISFILETHSQVPITINQKSIDSIYYRNNTKWVLFTPLFLVKQEFSTDYGNTWERVGMLGGHVKPYLLKDSIATQNIKLYKYTRLAGLVQMWIIAPLLAYKHYTYTPSENFSSGDYTTANIDENLSREESGYLTASIIIFFTGTLTYHIFSKKFLYRSLHDYNHGILNDEFASNTSIKMDFKIEPRSQVPQLSFTVSF